MDRRQQKTRDAIFTAFNDLLNKKKYNSITVQDIIDRANIGRSTFYSHFETKDELLKAMCTDIFNHVFSKHLDSEKTHDFSDANHGLEPTLTHVLYHLQDSKTELTGILSSESGEVFMSFLKQYLRELFSKYMDIIKVDAPDDFIINHLVGSFSEAIIWWINAKMKVKPEQVAKYFVNVIGLGCCRDCRRFSPSWLDK